MDVGVERQFGVAETVLGMLDDLCSRAPLVLAIEDLHWSDPATLGVLARIARGIERLPVALIVSARPQPRRPELERLLAVLADAGRRALRWDRSTRARARPSWRGSSARSPEPSSSSRRSARGGNPLFVSELVAALDADGAIVARTDGPTSSAQRRCRRCR